MPLQLVCLRTPPPHPSRTGQNAKNKSESARGSRQRCFMRWREENERNEPTPPSEAGRLATRPRSRPQLPPALFNRWARAPGSGTRHWPAGAGCPASRPLRCQAPWGAAASAAEPAPGRAEPAPEPRRGSGGWTRWLRPPGHLHTASSVFLQAKGYRQVVPRNTQT